MRSVEIEDEIYDRVDQFKAVVAAVLGDHADVGTCFGMVIDRGLDCMLSDIIGRQKESTLVQSLQQLAARHPEIVYGYVAEMIERGADSSAGEEPVRPIGFRRN